MLCGRALNGKYSGSDDKFYVRLGEPFCVWYLTWNYCPALFFEEMMLWEGEKLKMDGKVTSIHDDVKRMGGSFSIKQV